MNSFADRYRVRGTRFRVYPQLKGLRGVATPETVYVDAAPGTIGPGPSDDRMYVVDADGKLPYDDTGLHPPYRGSRLPPVVPRRDGHFDHLRPGTREFSAASVFAIARCVLDTWERYFGRQQTPPWNGDFIGLYRMKDWLSLLGFEVIGGRLDCYVPPFKQEKVISPPPL